MPYGGDPSASDSDYIRFIIRDTAASPYFSDTEVAAILAAEGSRDAAAGRLLKMWVREMLTMPNFTLGSFSENHGATLSELMKDAQNLIDGGATVGLYAGGISQADNEAIAADTDRVPPYFRTGMMENPDAENPNDDTDSD